MVGEGPLALDAPHCVTVKLASVTACIKSQNGAAKPF
jgi:hypothetical protein